MQKKKNEYKGRKRMKFLRYIIILDADIKQQNKKLLLILFFVPSLEFLRMHMLYVYVAR